MGNAEILFEKIQVGGFEYIKNNLLGKEVENCFLECKTKENPDEWFPSGNDLKYFAKALSGFANTEGGVLIFGLDARKNVRDGVDKINGIKPIPEIGRFTQRLKEEENNCVDRNVRGVDYCPPIKVEGNKGILAILIPESDIPPHQSIKEHRFFIRVGGSFHKPCVTQIENLFYKKLSPDLSFVIEPTSEVENIPGEERQTKSYLFGIKNSGRVVAKFLKLELRFNQHQAYIARYGLDEKGHHWLSRQPKIPHEPKENDLDTVERFVGDASKLVYPDDTAWVSNIKHIFYPGSVSALLINYKIYAENFVGIEGRVRVCGNTIEYDPET